MNVYAVKYGNCDGFSTKLRLRVWPGMFKLFTLQGHFLSNKERGNHHGKWYLHNGTLYSGIQLACKDNEPHFIPNNTWGGQLNCYGKYPLI